MGRIRVRVRSLQLCLRLQKGRRKDKVTEMTEESQGMTSGEASPDKCEEWNVSLQDAADDGEIVTHTVLPS